MQTASQSAARRPARAHAASESRAERVAPPDVPRIRRQCIRVGCHPPPQLFPLVLPLFERSEPSSGRAQGRS